MNCGSANFVESLGTVGVVMGGVGSGRAGTEGGGVGTGGMV